MQGKVSMVVPCYNKANYIGAMLDSVIAQEWDNIELILVNDGSTDGTREIIAEYEAKIRARGYELQIIDQENAGCCAAVYAGLIRMTGDYFCLVDCDDEIEPKYVSHMANWLDTHDDYEWTACSFRSFSRTGNTVKQSNMAEKKYRPDTDRLLEKYILRETITTVWIYMSRVSYVKKCGVIDNFCTERRKTYEPLIMVPLAAGEGKLEFFNEPLYRYNQTSLDLFRFDRFEQCLKYYEDYLYLYEWAIGRLEVSREYKRLLIQLVSLAYYKELFSPLTKIPDGEEYREMVAKGFSKTVNEMFEPSPNVTAEIILWTGFLPLYKILTQKLLDECPNNEMIPPQRIIGYGALGKSASRWLSLLRHSPWMPTELWDKNGDGVNVKKPDFNSLSEEDTVLVFPVTKVILDEIKVELEHSPSRVMYVPEMKDKLDSMVFGHFRDVGLKQC